MSNDDGASDEVLSCWEAFLRVDHPRGGTNDGNDGLDDGNLCHVDDVLWRDELRAVWHRCSIEA